MAKIGDKVRFLNSIGGGTVVRIEGNVAYVTDEDGFETPTLICELVVVAAADSFKPKEAGPVVTMKPEPQKAPEKKKEKSEQELEPEETDGGDILNVVLAYEPENLKMINTTAISVYLVNDSNYYLYFAYMTSPDANTGWTTRYAGVVEPNIQIYLGDVNREDINQMGRVAVQYLAFKRDKCFDRKQPAFVEHKFDTTKFFKLHCYRENMYFDTPVIALDIVRDDKPFTEQPTVSSGQVEKDLKHKIRADRQVRKPVVKRKEKRSERRNGEIIEVDLHITELVDTIRGLSNADMLNLQIDEFRRVMDANLHNHGQKIVFIHGKGEGVLRQAIIKELAYRYKEHRVQDASFQEYGYGATQVTIK